MAKVAKETKKKNEVVKNWLKNKKKEKYNGGLKANNLRVLQIYGDLKWHFQSKSSKFDLLINKRTYKYINIS